MLLSGSWLGHWYGSRGGTGVVRLCLGSGIASRSIFGNTCPGQTLSWVELCYLASSLLKGLYGSVTTLEINRVPWVVIEAVTEGD